MTFPVDQESGNNPRNYTRFTLLFLKVRYRSLVGDSNAANKVPLLIKGAPSQTSNLVELYDSSNNGLFAVGPDGSLIYSGVTKVASFVKQVALTAAQIITLHSAPVALVAAPGAGKALFVKACHFQMAYGTTQFTTGGAVNPVYHGATTNLLSGSVAAATINAAATAHVSCGAPAAALALTANTGVDLYAGTADFAAGDSTGIATIEYDVITIG